MITDTLIKTLADIGFMASSTGHTKHAFAIFGGIETARPDSALPGIGYALEFMNKKKYQEAITILRQQALKKEPDNTAAQAFMGLALMLDGHNKESEDCLSKIAHCDDPAVVNMANELLSDIRNS